MRNDAKNGRILLSDIDLLIIDEAHHATGSDSMAQLGDMYLESSSNALVLAATASPGVRDSKVLEIVQRLGIERLHVAKREDDLLQPFITAMEIKKHYLDLSETLMDVINPLKILEEEEAEFLRRGGFLIRTNRITTAAIEEAQKRASAVIARGDARGYDAAKRIGDMRRLHRLIDLLETQGLRTAIKYLNRARTESNRKTKRFLSLPQVSYLYKNFSSMEEIHPKPKMVEKLVSVGLANDGKVIIFTEYRDTVDQLVETLENTEGVKAGKFVGQTNKANSTGMKQKEQLAQLEKFRNGEINVLIATSVGEEGLDVPTADSVILYEPVPSAIRAIQRRGRTARQRDGDVIILIAKGSRDEYVQHASVKREDAMYRTLAKLQKQSRLPRRAAPKEDILSSFSVEGIDAETFISQESERLYRAPKIIIQEEKETINKKRQTSTITNLPRAQKSLSDFSSTKENANDSKWWNPVLDGNNSKTKEDE